MMSRLLKQIIIAFIFLLIIVGLVFLIYLSNKPKLSCFDGIKNQSEEKIDCGGPCPSCSEALEEIETLWVKVIPIGENYDLVAKIKNPNPNHGIGSLPYQFLLVNDQQEVLTRKTSESFILPGQTKYIIATSVEYPVQPAGAEIIFGNFEWEELKDFEEPRIIISPKEYQLLDPTEPGFSRASGTATNRSNYDFEKVQINVVLYGRSGQVIGVNKTQIRNLLSSEKRYFEATWYEQVIGEPRDIDVESEINVFKSETFMRQHGVLEKYQEYQ